MSNFTDLCRICASKLGKNRKNVFEPENRNVLATLMLLCNPMKISEDDSYPKSICSQCFSKLSDVTELRDKIIATAKIYQKTSSHVENTPSESDPNILVIKEEDLSDTEIYEETEYKYTIADSENSDESTDGKKSKPSSKYNCHECGKILASKISLITHQRTHSGEKPYSCKECGKTFTQQIILTKHLRTHTGEKPYPCKKCGKCFASCSGVVRHQMTHSGEKPFSCNSCEKSFSRKVNLIRHERAHSGEKPFSCKKCGKCYRRKTGLNKHILSHTGEKPFLCHTCGQCFAVKENLIKHSLKHDKVFS